MHGQAPFVHPKIPDFCIELGNPQVETSKSRTFRWQNMRDTPLFKRENHQETMEFGIFA